MCYPCRCRDVVMLTRSFLGPFLTASIISCLLPAVSKGGAFVLVCAAQLLSRLQDLQGSINHYYINNVVIQAALLAPLASSPPSWSRLLPPNYCWFTADEV